MTLSTLRCGLPLTVVSMIGVLLPGAVLVAGEGAEGDLRSLYDDAPTVAGNGAAPRSGPSSPLTFAADALGATWSPLFDAPPAGAGMSSSVNALTVYNGQLIAAGDFLRAGGVMAGRIAGWDGSAWTAFRTGLNDRAFALVVWNGLLVVGGQFAWADGVPVGSIAVWDGTGWAALGSPGGNVYALAVWQGQLVAGGTFPGAVRIWNGATWTVPGTTTVPGGTIPGLPGTVLALATYVAGGVEYLIAGGSFQTSAPALSNIAKWNGTGWSTLGTGTSDWVAATFARNDTLFVGGRFDFVNGTVAAGRVARWVPNTSGSGAWSSIGAASGTVLTLADYSGSLVAGGEFESVSGTMMNQVSAWNGTAWNSLGTGTGGTLFRPLVRCAAT